MEATSANQRRYLASAAIVVAIAAGAYGIGRVYPPLGPSAGTIAPADRYVSSQIGAGDVKLGDTSVPQLMQTDAFEVISKNPDFRNMANSPGFAALMANGPAMAAIAANPGAFQAISKDPKAFAEMANVAMLAKSRMVDMQAQTGALASVIATHAQTFRYMADNHPAALTQLMANAAQLGVLAKDPKAFGTGVFANALTKAGDGPQVAAQLMADTKAMQLLKADSGMFAAMADHAAAFQGLAANTNLMVSAIKQVGLMSQMGVSGPAMSSLASLMSTHAATLNALSTEPKALASIAQHAALYQSMSTHAAATQALLASGMVATWARDPMVFATNAASIPQLAAQAANLKALAVDAKVQAAMKADPAALKSMAASAQSLQAIATNAALFNTAMNTQALTAMANNASMRQVGARPLDVAMAAHAAMAFNAISSVGLLAANSRVNAAAAAQVANNAQAFAQMANTPQAFVQLASNNAAMSALAANTGVMAKLASVNGAMAMMANPGFAQAMQQMNAVGIRAE